MDTPETPEIPHKETRGRPGKMVRLTVEMPMADAVAAHALSGKRMKQTGEVVSLDRIISEAIQNYSKVLSGQEQ